ncbi:TPA: amidohydrolase [Photobacterium damselae]|uniref:amidohydrolase n=1 Tax=Photobacterium damselae TaxID=38293 RepID=UPI00159425B2|nr:amidohydrolase family protein [Photobacterium damselae]NVH47331.1 amidohydrolase family protein [Photobacterium damselae subsp. damselae]
MKIFKAKKIYTADNEFSCEEAMVVDGGKIIELGELDSLINKYPTAQLNLEYQDQCIYPGFIEPHLHIIGTAAMFAAVIPASFTEWTIDGRTYPAVRDRESFLAALKDRVDEFKDRETLIVWGHYEPLHGPLTTAMLDDIDNSRPFAVWGASIHKLTMNTKAIEAFKVNELPKDIFGFIQDENGQSTGVLIEQAMFKTVAEHVLSKVTPQGIMQGLHSVLSQGRDKGVTACVDMGVGISMPLDAELQLLRASENVAGMPKCRKGYMFGWQKVYEAQDWSAQTTFDYVNQHYLDNKDNQTLFPVKCIKFFADGAVSDYEIITKEPFQDGRETGWLHRFADRTEDTLPEDMQMFWDNDFNIAIHTQGDLAHAKVLDALESLSANGQGRDGQMFIQHMGFTDDEFFARVKEMPYKPSASITPYYSYHFYESWHKEQLLPKSCFSQLQRARSAVDAGMKISVNADIPLMPTNPLMGAYIVMSRRDYHGTEVLPQESISREEALRCITSSAAEQHLLDEIGSLEPGKLADFTVLDFDWMNDDIEALKQLNATACFVNGEQA